MSVSRVATAHHSRYGLRAVIVVSATAAVLAAVGLVVAAGHGGSSSSDETSAVAAYASSAQGLTHDGGRLVVQAIKPGIDDLYFGRVTPQGFRDEAVGWGQQLEQVRVRLAALTAPPQLSHAAQLYDQSLRGYEAALDAFVAASRQPQDQLRAAISAAAHVAANADRVDDEADAAVTAELARVGLPTPAPVSANLSSAPA